MKIHFTGKKRESYILCNPRTDDPLSYYLGSKSRALIFFSATKPVNPVEIKYLIQGQYRGLFGRENTKAGKPQKG